VTLDREAELSEEEFRLLRELIHERFGLFFEDAQRATLRTRLLGRLASLDLLSFEDYYRYLRFGPGRQDELQRMVCHLTNNETYFYREMPQLQVFADPILRRVKETKSEAGPRALRVLSAGCSTGEEAHTLAMVIWDSGHFFWNWDVSVVGMDVDTHALDKARRAVYHHNSFRGLSPAVFERHFVRGGEGGGAQVKEAVRKMVRFRHGNLVEAQSYEGLAPLDAVFCRNVLIYFSDAMILRVVRFFHEVLAPGGYLFLGHAESLSRITDLFTPVRFQGAMVYRKPPAEAA
jgi:chemotaxis protein methyltransferase CheR